MKYEQGYRLRTSNPARLPRRACRVDLFLVGLSVIFFTGCVNKAQQTIERPPSPVQVTAAVSQDVPTYLDAIGAAVDRHSIRR